MTTVGGDSVTGGVPAQPAVRVQKLEDSLRRVYMWISDPALSEDEDTAITEARRICREALGMIHV